MMESKQPELNINNLINIAFDLCCRRNDLSDEDWKKAKEKAKEDAIKEVKPFVEYHLKQHATAAVSAGISAIGIRACRQRAADRHLGHPVHEEADFGRGLYQKHDRSGKSKAGERFIVCFENR